MSDMVLVLSHISALEYLNSLRRLNPQSRVVSSAQFLISQPPCLNSYDLEKLGLSTPIHLLVSNDVVRRNSHKTVCHACSYPLKRGYILEWAEGLFTVSPELMFLQAATELPLIGLMRLGFEICGSYYVKGKTLYQGKPLSTVKRLELFIEKAGNLHGSKKARQALRYILDNSASPMETALAMLLSLPYKLGGYGIPQPFLNHRIESAVISTSSGCYICDFYWPLSKLAVEYDSNLFHTGAERITEDSIRRSELLASGITVVSITLAQIKDREKMDNVVHLLARLTSKRIRFIEPQFTHANTALRKCILSRSAPWSNQDQL